MTNKLEPIILQKQREVAALYEIIESQPTHPLAMLLQGNAQSAAKSFKCALESDKLAIIAEIKRHSPSKGFLATINDPVDLANTYIESGANALSILTDESFFSGTIEDLRAVAQAIKKNLAPILRKDFIIDEIQIAESRAQGADAILCIVAVLGEKIKKIMEKAKFMGLDVLVEVHDRYELDLALDCGAEIIGVNNRNLATFEVDTELAFKLLPHIPKQIVKVAESGIIDPNLAKEYYHAGFDAVLIGEALVKAKSPAHFIRACHHD